MPASTSQRDLLIYTLEGQIQTLLDQAATLQHTVTILKQGLAQQDTSRGSVLHRRAPLASFSVRELDLSDQTKNLLWKNGIETVAALVSKTSAQILAIKNADSSTVTEIRTVLARRGCTLGMTVSSNAEVDCLRQTPP